MCGKVRTKNIQTNQVREHFNYSDLQHKRVQYYGESNFKLASMAVVPPKWKLNFLVIQSFRLANLQKLSKQFFEPFFCWSSDMFMTY